MTASTRSTLYLLAAALLTAVALWSCDTTRASDDDDDDNDDGSGGSTSSGTGGTTTVPGGPEVIDLVASPPTITEAGVVTFTATVTDPDGAEDILGGMLSNADSGASYGPFAQLSPGMYSINLTWQQIHGIEAIEFDADIVRNFRADFTDTTQKVGSRTAGLTLTCNGYPACEGGCATAQYPLKCSSLNCGTCLDFINNPGVEWDMLCPNSPPILDALVECLCSLCATECAEECDLGTSVGSCEDCRATTCGSQWNACVADEG